LIFSGSISGDFDGNAVNGDETLNFSLTFNLDGTYVFDLEERFASSTSFSSDDGQLPAGGPDSVQTLPVGDDDILFFALDPLAYADMDEWVDDGSPAPEPDDYIVTHVLAPSLDETGLETLNPSFLDPAFLMNVSTSGIGVNNNNLQGDGIVGITAGDQSFIVNTQTELTSMKVFIDNSVSGYNTATEDLYYRVFFVDGSYSDYILVESEHLTAEGGGQVSFTIDYDDPLLEGGGELIDAVQLTMGIGKIKIPTIEFTQETAVALDPITIDFDATLTDYDGDSVTDDFAVEIGTDGDPLVPPDITIDGTSDADAFNIDLASGFTTWVINGFDSTDGVEIDGDKIVLLNPLYDYNLVTGPDNDTITINGTTVTITNGAEVLTSADILVAYADVVIDGDILVGDTLNQNVTGTADADALIVKEDLNTVTGGDGGDVFVFFDPDFSVNSVADFDSSE
ncbi:MAG TPA: hypothetical protein VLA12_04355, partial [Planctomycetaceae bacterium]|nr:hypothetical protein [Planctomycetaceae bacterium]